MKALKIIKAILFGLIYGTNLFLAVCLWLCGQSGNIMLGILLICLYRPSLWFSPLWLTIVCWLPTRPKRPIYQRIIFNLAHLAICGLLFVICFMLFWNWY